MRKAGFVLSIILLFLSVVGLQNGITEFGDADNALGHSVHVVSVLYGVLGLTAGVGLVRRRPWSVTLSVAWAISVCWVATVASFAFHDLRFQEEGTLVGTIAAFLATALTGAFVVWNARRNVTQPVAPGFLPADETRPYS